MKTVCFLLILICSAICQDQHDSLIIEVMSGVESGWWVYNKGSTEEGVQNNLGRDRTGYRLFLPTELNIFYKMHRFKIGAGINHSWFFENTMFSSTDSYFYRDRYSVSKNAVKILKVNLAGEFDLIQKMKYALSPVIKFGIFQIDTTHPEKANFGMKTFWGFGITNQIKLSKFNLILRPVYYLLTIKPDVQKANHEQHNIYSLGLNIGLRYSLL
jgi:hypothetical protein